MSLICASNLSIGYRGHIVAQSISFDVTAGEIVAIVGANGAGKTTLLKTLVGILPPISGSLEYDFDRHVNPLGYVPQRDNLDPIFPLTALDVVVMGRNPTRSPWSSFAAEDWEIAEECLRKVNLAELKARPFFELSGGQRQRVLIARALSTKSKILFLDEPTAGIDPGAEAVIVELLLHLHAVENLTLLIVSHHLAVVKSLIPSVIIMERGRGFKATTKDGLNDERIRSIYGLTTSLI